MYILIIIETFYLEFFTSFSIPTDRFAKIDLINLNGKPALPDGTPYGKTPLRTYSYYLQGNLEPVLYRRNGEQNLNNIVIRSSSALFECICESIIFLQ